MDDNQQQDPGYYEEPGNDGFWNPLGNKPEEKSPDNLPHENDKKPQDRSNVHVETGAAFSLPFISLPGKRDVHNVKECFIVLFNHFMTYKIIGEYDQFDEQLEVMVPKKANYRWTRMRKDITDVNMYFDNGDRMYGVTLEFGKNENTWMFSKGADAKRIYDILQNYFVTRDQPEFGRIDPDRP